jgi:hypothetical protein
VVAGVLLGALAGLGTGVLLAGMMGGVAGIVVGMALAARFLARLLFPMLPVCDSYVTVLGSSCTLGSGAVVGASVGGTTLGSAAGGSVASVAGGVLMSANIVASSRRAWSRESLSGLTGPAGVGCNNA